MIPLIPIAMQLAQFAPGIIKLLTGSDKAEEVAGKVVDVAKVITGTSDPVAAVAAIQANPEKAMEFQLAMGAQQIEFEKIYLTDTQDARARDVELAKAGYRNSRANILAISAYTLVLLGLAIVVWSAEMDDFAKGTITLVVGRALGWVEQVFSFEFGTTRASKAKDDTINKLSGS